MLYVAVLVALAKPIWGKCAKTLLLMMFVCGTAVVFSHTELADHTFWETVKLLYEQGQGALGGGVLGGVVGGSLLVLCGRPAANILLVVLLGAATMWFAGVTPVSYTHLDVYKRQELLSMLPKEELDRVDQVMLDHFYKPKADPKQRELGLRRAFKND